MDEGILVDLNDCSSQIPPIEPNEKDRSTVDFPGKCLSKHLSKEESSQLNAGVKIEQDLRDTFGFLDIPSRNQINPKSECAGHAVDLVKAEATSQCQEGLLIDVDIDDMTDTIDWNLVQAEVDTITSQLTLSDSSPSKGFSLSPFKAVQLYDSSPESVRSSPAKKTPKKVASCTPKVTDLSQLKKALDRVKSYAVTPSATSANTATPSNRPQQIKRNGPLHLRGKRLTQNTGEGVSKSTISRKPANTTSSTTPKLPIPKTEANKHGSSRKPNLPSMKQPLRPALSTNDSSLKNSSTNSSHNNSSGVGKQIKTNRQVPLRATSSLQPFVRSFSSVGSLSTNESSDASRTSVASPAQKMSSAPAAASTPALRTSRLKPLQTQTPSKVPLALTASFASPIAPPPRFQLERQKSLPVSNIGKRVSPVKSSNVLCEKTSRSVNSGQTQKSSLPRRPTTQHVSKTQKENWAK
ncbi:vitellogenin-like [Artemia franciscana]